MRLVYLALLMSLLSSVVLGYDFLSTVDPSSIYVGQNTNFTLAFDNTNETNASGVNITLPTQVVYVSDSQSSSYEFSTIGSTLIWKGNFTNDTVADLKFNLTASSNSNVSANITVKALYGTQIISKNITLGILNNSALNGILASVNPTSVSNSSSYRFALSINNTNSLDITDITLTLPSFLTFISGSNASSSTALFSNTSTQLKWTGNVSSILNETFYFNASVLSSVATTGMIAVNATYQGQTITKDVILTVTGSSTQSPSSVKVNLTSPANSSTTGSLVTFSCLVNDSVGIRSVALYLSLPDHESTELFDVVNVSGNPTTTIMSRTINSMVEGKYKWNCLVNNSNGITAFAAFDSTLFVDSSAPLINFTNTTPANNASISSGSFAVNFTYDGQLSSAIFVLSSTGNNSTTIVNATMALTPDYGYYSFNGSNMTLKDGYYEYTITIKDNLNNTRSSKRGIFLDRIKPVVYMTNINSVGQGSSFRVDCSATDNIDRSFNYTHYLLRNINSTSRAPIDTGSKFGTNYTINVTSNFTQQTGSYMFACAAFDRAGNYGLSNQTYVISASSQQNQTTQQQSWQSPAVSITDSAEFIVTDSSIGVSRVSVSVVSPANNVQITLAKYSAAPGVTSAPNTVYRYIKLDHANLNDSQISGASIDFSIENSWLAANNVDKSSVKLYRYSNGSWQALPTSVVTSTGSVTVFKATSPGLSIFAVSGTQRIEPVQEEEQVQDEREEVPQDESSGTGVLILVFIVFFLAIGGAGIWYLYKKGVFVVMSIPERNPV